MTLRVLRTALVVVACSLTAHAAETPSLAVTPTAVDTTCGEPFELLVVRRYAAGANPSAWDAAALEPLAAVLEDRRLSTSDGEVEETLRFRCQAFAVADVTIAAPTFTVGDTSRPVTGEDITVRVRPTLDPLAPGPPELPGPPLPEPRSPLPWIGAAAAVVIGLLLWARSRRSEAPPPIEVVAEPESHAAGDLAQLAPTQIPDAAADLAFHAELARVLRGHIGAQLHRDIREWTSEELISSAEVSAVLGVQAVSELATALGDADRVKFAAHRSTLPERERALEAAEAVVSDESSAG